MKKRAKKVTELKGTVQSSYTTTGIGDSFYVTICLHGKRNYGCNFMKNGDEVIVLHQQKKCEGNNKGKFQLKVDSHNTITIHPIKDSFTKEEVREKMWFAIVQYQIAQKNMKDVFNEVPKWFDEWIEKSL